MNELEVLKAVRNQIEADPDVLACNGVDRAGGECVWELIYREALRSTLGSKVALRTLQGLALQLGADELEVVKVYRFNDAHPWEDVRDLLNRRISVLEEHESGDPLPPLPVLHPELVS